MLLSVDDARQLALNFLKRGGIPESEAEIITGILLESELRGRKTHGFIRLSGIKNRYAKSENAYLIPLCHLRQSLKIRYFVHLVLPLCHQIYIQK